ncbi:DUF6326 family protein [Saccharothrix syringae]|uniref:Uncharacterized protein n=1 Tax=Saccharothrix syringae TaxID=103733 RepID=A0A5Q0GWS7_SACSY|nr:DUF6326 family protein [Saccharothrix syringae]QFZ18391.1 hypothetical protein EKG83_13660 [Saccharothrix syringae]
MRTTPTRQYRDTPVDVKLALCALWVTMLFVFAYVDIFGFYRADVLNAALDGKVASTPLAVDQTFLTATLVYLLPSILMVVLTLLLKPRANRAVNLIVGSFYLITVIASGIGETWVYYLLGSLVEAVLLVVIIRTAWKWPSPVPSLP